MATGSPRSASGVLRYGALVEALISLHGDGYFKTLAPTERGLRYRRGFRRGVAPLLDIYLPTTTPTRASVLLVHGGGFVLGSRAMKPMRFLASHLASAGIAVGSLDYRLIFRGGRLEESLDDVRAGLAFFRERVTTHGMDPGRVSLVGLSAGGTLAMLAASAEPRAVHRLVCAFGLYELDHLNGPLASAMPRLLFRTSDREAWSARSPRGVPQPDVPTLLMHGSDDGLVPVEQARRLAEHRRTLGLPTKLVVYAGAPHGFFNLPIDAAFDGTRELIAHVGAD